MHQKRVSVVGVLPYGQFAQGVKSSPFTPINRFSMGRLSCYFVWELIVNAPYD